MVVRTYTLPVDQLERLREAGGPLAEQPDLSTLADAAIPVVEVDGRVVAYCPIFYAVHTEPLWITDELRNNVAVGRAILAAVAETLAGMGVAVSFAVIEPNTAEGLAPYAERLGFVRVPGDLYYVVHTPADAPVGV